MAVVVGFIGLQFWVFGWCTYKCVKICSLWGNALSRRWRIYRPGIDNPRRR